METVIKMRNHCTELRDFQNVSTRAKTYSLFFIANIDNMQHIADAVQKGLQIFVRASFQQGRARLTRLRNELCSDSFHAVLAWSCGPAKCQCCAPTVTVVVYV